MGAFFFILLCLAVYGGANLREKACKAGNPRGEWIWSKVTNAEAEKWVNRVLSSRGDECLNAMLSIDNEMRYIFGCDDWEKFFDYFTATPPTYLPNSYYEASKQTKRNRRDNNNPYSCCHFADPWSIASAVLLAKQGYVKDNWYYGFHPSGVFDREAGVFVGLRICQVIEANLLSHHPNLPLKLWREKYDRSTFFGRTLIWKWAFHYKGFRIRKRDRLWGTADNPSYYYDPYAIEIRESGFPIS